MNICPIQNTISYTGLVPASEYKGIVLKLTKKDKEQIEALQKLKAQYILDLDKLKSISRNGKPRSEGEDYYLWEKTFGLSVDIESLDKEIRQIKLDRLAKQKARLEKKARKLDIEG